MICSINTDIQIRNTPVRNDGFGLLFVIILILIRSVKRPLVMSRHTSIAARCSRLQRVSNPIFASR